VSFISLTKVLPAVIHVMAAPAELVTLIKPQFEAGREHVERGGVVRSEEVRRATVERIRAIGERELGLEWLGVRASPLKGPAGNVEFLALWRRPAESLR
jgi:23S rRNA (cytidine1920-2'-O)/16S rRNA (cytidine1409-2'-O)-methyltransferase